MCGIAGILRVGPDADTASGRDLADVTAMTDALRHRGPDHRSSWVSPSGRCTLGHTRLRVIDLETGDQPMPNEDGSVQIVFNGEIYNFGELRRELARAGHRFRTRSDTEVIAHGYEEWGPAVTTRLDGMFAFGLWDEKRRTLLLARDRAGKKPLYVYRDAGRVAFASELGALSRLTDFDDRLRSDAVPLFLMYGYVPAPHTFYESVEKLAPAHWTTVVEDGSETRERYWSLDWTPRRDAAGDNTAALRAHLTSAVERRLVSDVPLGAFLSGGVDSTLIVALMRQVAGPGLRTFSIGFEDDPLYDETGFAKEAARTFGTEHTEFRVGASDVDLLDDLVDAYDEPFGDSSAIPTYIVSRLTREHVTVALTGDGGDEMFAGYPRFLGNVVAERVPSSLARFGRWVGGRLPHNPDFRSVSRRFTRFMDAASLDTDERMLRWIGFLAGSLDEMVRPEVMEDLDRVALLESYRTPLSRVRGQSPLVQALALNFETYLPEDLLVKADRCSMAHGLELRSPFLDTNLMEFAAGLGDGDRIRRGTLKALLKSAFADTLPPSIARRPKMGFGVPLPAWFRGPWRSLIEERLVHVDARIHAWVRPESVRALAEEHWSGQQDHGHALWALLTLETWLGRGRYRT